MADTVQESNFFPPLRTSWPHIMRSFCFYSQVHGVHSIREKRPPRVSAARRAGLFSLSLSLSFFYGCRRQQTRFRRIWPRLVSLPRPDSDRPRSDRSWFRECAAKLAATRSDGDPRGRVSERERESDTKREGGREKALTTVARIDLAPSVIFIAGQKMFSRTLWNEKSISFVLQLQRNWKDVTFGTISSRNFLHGFIM